MTRVLRASPALLLGAILAGCAAGPTVPTPTPTPTPTASATSAPTPTSTVAPVALATTEAVSQAARDTDPAPTASYVSTIDGAPAFFENSSVTAPGMWATRISCASAAGADVVIVIETPEGDDQQIEAPCGVGVSIATVDGPVFESTTSYRITSTAVEPAVVAVALAPR